MHRWAIVLALAGCTATVADQALGVCQALCHCSDTPLPGEQRACISVCSAQFEMNPLGDACAACVVEHAQRCTTLLSDCETLCTQAIPLSRLPSSEDRQ
jgi:hypothetical protein